MRERGTEKDETRRMRREGVEGVADLGKGGVRDEEGEKVGDIRRG